MRKSTSGFTIVELGIVITVIAILAAITIVVYSGAQANARTAQTKATTTQWIKALELYKVRNGTYPTVESCLGENYKYNEDGAGSSGVGQCRQSDGSTGVEIEYGFISDMAMFIDYSVTPAMVTASNGSTNWWRGMRYAVNGSGQATVVAVYDAAAQNCPTIGEFSGTKTTTADGNFYCTYVLGNASSY